MCSDRCKIYSPTHVLLTDAFVFCVSIVKRIELQALGADLLVGIVQGALFAARLAR